MKICVFGLWHLGTITSACLAERGFDVIGLDLNNNTIKKLNEGIAPLFEPELENLIEKNLKSGNLKFTSNPQSAIEDADMLWVTFDTPVDENDKADSDYVFNNIKNVLNFLKSNTGIIVSSQVPVGFTRRIEREFQKINKNKTVFFAYSPENLRLGKAIKVFNSPYRILIGIRKESDKLFFRPFFEKFSRNLIWMRVESAEMTKHAINAFLALSITFINEIASLCEFLGADAREVEIGLKSEERIGEKAYLKPGAPFAGGTLARDINFLNTFSKEYGLPSYLLNGINKSNKFHKTWVQRKIRQNFENLDNKRFLIIGLTYKEGTSTLRRSLSIELINWLIKERAEIDAYDPEIFKLPRYLNKKVKLIKNIDQVIKYTDCLIIMTGKSDFLKKIDLHFINAMKNKIIIDANGLLEDKVINDPEVHYFKVGKQNL